MAGTKWPTWEDGGTTKACSPNPCVESAKGEVFSICMCAGKGRQVILPCVVF